MGRMAGPRLLVVALAWFVVVLALIGPRLMEALDRRQLTGSLLGLPVLVTEVLVIGILAVVPLMLLWRRESRRNR